MLGSSLYLVGKECPSGEYVKDASSCGMCKRLIINSGIERVIIRLDKFNFKVIQVSQWIENDDSLEGFFGY